MSRHLIIRCDAPGCAQQTETRASDTEPTAIATPQGWLTLVSGEGYPHRHYCSLACLLSTAPHDEQPAQPEPKRGGKRARP